MWSTHSKLLLCTCRFIHKNTSHHSQAAAAPQYKFVVGARCVVSDENGEWQVAVITKRRVNAAGAPEYDVDFEGIGSGDFR